MLFQLIVVFFNIDDAKGSFNNASSVKKRRIVKRPLCGVFALEHDLDAEATGCGLLDDILCLSADGIRELAGSKRRFR